MRRHDRLIGALIAATIGATCASLAGLFGNLRPLEAATVEGGIVGGIVGACLAPSVRGADRVKQFAVGGAAGVLVLPVAGLSSGLGGFADSLAAGGVGIADAPAVIAGMLISPILFFIFGAPGVLLLLPAGLAWAAVTYRLIGGAAAPSLPERTADIRRR